MQLAAALSLVAVGAFLVVGLVKAGRVELLGPQDVNMHLRSSGDSVAWACGGKEAADVCLLGTETCVAVSPYLPHYSYILINVSSLACLNSFPDSFPGSRRTNIEACQHSQSMQKKVGYTVAQGLAK